ncbi:hypothetical protein ACET3Z_023866 [Daucus carota]
MSGGVGPVSEISGSEQEDEAVMKEKQEHKVFTKPKKTNSFSSLQQLNALAVIIVLSASGMVSIQDFAFVVFTLFYMYFISKVAFPTFSSSAEPPVFGEKNRILGLYVFIGALIGLFLPIAYIFEGVVEGDKEGIQAAVPHVFLLASQVFMEGVAFSDRFSLPIRVFVPVVYNSARIFTIMDWLRTEISKGHREFSGSERRLVVGRGLAVANLAFWCFNLFGFLLPFYMPKAFKAYYSSSPEIKKAA